MIITEAPLDEVKDIERASSDGSMASTSSSSSLFSFSSLFYSMSSSSKSNQAAPDSVEYSALGEDPSVTARDSTLPSSKPLHLPVILLGEPDPSTASGRRPACLNVQRAEALRVHLPVYLQIAPWRLLYSLYDHGSDMTQFYRNVASHRCTVLLISTTCGALFGGVASHEWRPTTSYYGSGMSFLFRFSPTGVLSVYPWSGENEYFQWASSEQIAMGGGGKGFGFVVDNDFRAGSTACCATFNNMPLTAADRPESSSPSQQREDRDHHQDEGDKAACSKASNIRAEDIHQFEVLNIEVWSFEVPANKVQKRIRVT